MSSSSANHRDDSPREPVSPLVDFACRHAHVTLFSSSRQSEAHGYRLQSRVVSRHNFIFLTRGKAVWVLDDEPVTFGAGDLLIVPPGPRHYGYSTTQRVTLLSLHITARLAGGQDVLELLAPPRTQRVARGTALDQYLRGAMAEYQRGAGDETSLMLRPWAQLITLELLRDNDRRGLLQPRPLDPIVTEVMSALNERVDQPTSLDELAQWAGYSAQHLNRLFRRQLGITPLQYLARLRMQRAARLLAEGELTVQAIAARVGYSDPYYFSRLFKQHTGQSPAQYRAAAALDAGGPPGGEAG